MSGFGINTVTISGNLTKDPEQRQTQSGNVTSFRLAHNNRVQREGKWVGEPEFFDITFWRGTGEWIARNLKKGDAVTVNGRLRWRSWEANGVKRQAVDIVGFSLTTASRRGTGPEPEPEPVEDPLPF